MHNLPVINGRELEHFFLHIGYKTVRQRGSHLQLQKEKHMITIPIHSGVALGTEEAILKELAKYENTDYKTILVKLKNWLN